MKILFVASECTPIVKVGGLGDVIGSLPKALANLGQEIVVAIPGYQTVDFSSWKKLPDFAIHFSGEVLKITPYKTVLPNSQVVLLSFCEERYISSGGIYFSKTAFVSSQDEINRFVVFSLAVSHWLTKNGPFDIVHCHDWHTGLLPHFLNDLGITARKVFTIHNLANQGFSSLVIDKKLGGHISHDQLLSWDAADDNLDFILQGVGCSDWITTVSPGYSREILTPEFGEGLNQVLKSREGRILGILNGIDYDFWNPSTDPYLKAYFDTSNYPSKKQENRLHLEKLVGLQSEQGEPLFGFIGRLTSQKGLDLILGVLPYILERGQLLILGKGAPEIEQALAKAASDSKGKMVYVNTQDNFHEDYEHLMYGACDFFLVPSRFEPCGLVQMIAMHYGAIPIAHAVGGLKDSIIDGRTGFLFDQYSCQALQMAIDRALAVYKERKLDEMINRAMAADFSWSKSASEYAKLYEKAIKNG
jgi:starch synthase